MADSSALFRKQQSDLLLLLRSMAQDVTHSTSSPPSAEISILPKPHSTGSLTSVVFSLGMRLSARPMGKSSSTRHKQACSWTKSLQLFKTRKRHIEASYESYMSCQEVLETFSENIPTFYDDHLRGIEEMRLAVNSGIPDEQSASGQLNGLLWIGLRCSKNWMDCL